MRCEAEPLPLPLIGKPVDSSGIVNDNRFSDMGGGSMMIGEVGSDGRRIR
jgi:hypothetical protein